MMEEDAGIKAAPTTRLRRRLSVEQTDEAKSPAVGTPTKKRGGRRAAKPELELIDENSPDNSTKQRESKKTVTKDVIQSEGKTLTPRRSTRINSNSSLISEPILAVDSPRSKRAARRASFAGSDNEAPATPIRQTRRTRKDSSSSIEKEPQLTGNKQGTQITEVIIEEPEIGSRKSTSHSESTTIEQNNSPNNTRKSPRLLKKNNTPTKSTAGESSKDVPNHEPKTISILESSKKPADDQKSKEVKHDQADETNIETPTQERKRLSTSSAILIKQLDTKTTNKIFNLNKSLSNTKSEQIKPKRKRTKSWTSITASNNNKFYSDNEDRKNKAQQNFLMEKLGAGDSSLNINQDKSKRNKKDSLNIVVKNIDSENTNSLDNAKAIENNIELENENLPLKQNKIKDEDVNTSDILAKEPSGDIKTLILNDDSDSSAGKVNIQSRHENEDQCVPVIENPVEIFPQKLHSILDKNEDNIILNKSKELTKMNDPCEPMDIDETISESIIFTDQNKELSEHISNISNEDIVNKSEKKNFLIQSLDKSVIETKSTLILSQFKDLSALDINNGVKSPQVAINHLSKSVDDLNVSQENDVKKKLSLHYSTSTPLQDKNVQRFKEIYINASMSSKNNDSKNKVEQSNQSIEKNYSSKNSPSNTLKTKHDLSSEDIKLKQSPKKDISNIQIENSNLKNFNESINKQQNKKSYEPSFSNSNQSAEAEPSKKNLSISSNVNDSEQETESENNSNFIHHEAIDAGDDYESGDSQDESERQYEKENEVIDHGQTLTSEDEITDDTDYEKDSFVVSSDEQDEELLDGTDNDLSMSDNELKMTAKSKKKYNERKIKEQKKASREMYNSRHKVNTSNNSLISEIGTASKNRRQVLSSSESEDEIVKSKKSNRLRLDSTEEASILENTKEHKISKKTYRHLSDSNSDVSASNEKEITVCNESIKEVDPLSAQVKIEPKTPQKSANSTIAFIDSEEVDKNELTRTQTELCDPLEDDDDSMSSDNENIMQNYDSILRDLNKSTKSKAKVCDISLNLDKKRKKKEKTTIVDELNLTQVKSAQKLKTKEKQEVNSTVKEIFSKSNNDDSLSDSINLHLLFSEDSNNSDDVQSQKKGESITTDSCIPIRRTEGKIDIRENETLNQSMNASLNKSATKKNKKRKSRKEDGENASNTEEALGFFIDTLGSYGDTQEDPQNISLKNNEQPIENIDETADTHNSSPLGVSHKKEKGSKRKSKSQDNMDTVQDEADETANSNNDAPLEISYKNEKGSKRKSKSQDNVDTMPDETDINENSDNEAPLEVSYKKEKGTKRVSKSQDNMDTVPDKIDASPNNNDSPLEISYKKEKGSKRKSKSQDNMDTVPDDTDVADKSLNKSNTKSSGSEKKMKKKTVKEESLEQAVVCYIADNSLNKSSTKSSLSDKKKKKITAEESLVQTVPLDENAEESSKKRERKSSLNSTKAETLPEEPLISETGETSSRKRKRKSSLNTTKEEVLPESVDSSKNLNESLAGSKKKKRKTSKQNDIIVPESKENEEDHHKLSSSKKQNKMKFENSVENNASKIVSEGTNKKRNRKRKNRDDDDTNQVSKVMKTNSFDKVSRLPPSLLMQLDEKPKKAAKTKKPKVVSTTQFLVEEETKKKKPSNYLEESIYLDKEKEESNRKKHKKRPDIPKVLPYTPSTFTSFNGSTNEFRVSVLPSEIKFVAQTNTISNFRENYLLNKKIKRVGTYELYKRQRSVKLAKF